MGGGIIVIIIIRKHVDRKDCNVLELNGLAEPRSSVTTTAWTNYRFIYSNLSRQG